MKWVALNTPYLQISTKSNTTLFELSLESQPSWDIIAAGINRFILGIFNEWKVWNDSQLSSPPLPTHGLLGGGFFPIPKGLWENGKPLKCLPPTPPVKAMLKKCLFNNAIVGTRAETGFFAFPCPLPKSSELASKINAHKCILVQKRPPSCNSVCPPWGGGCPLSLAPTPPSSWPCQWVWKAKGMKREGFLPPPPPHSPHYQGSSLAGQLSRG